LRAGARGCEFIFFSGESVDRLRRGTLRATAAAWRTDAHAGATMLARLLAFPDFILRTRKATAVLELAVRGADARSGTLPALLPSRARSGKRMSGRESGAA